MMGIVPGHGQPNGALYRCHSLICDITVSEQCPQTAHIGQWRHCT